MVALRGLTLDGLAHGGAAVGRAQDGRVVFVKAGCPGDVVNAEITADHGRYLEAAIAAARAPEIALRTVTSGALAAQ